MNRPVSGPGRRLRTAVCTLLLIAALGMLLGGIGCERQTSSGKLKVVVTIFPLADFVKNVAGDKVEVVTLLQAGDSPHTYEPSSGDMKAVAEARLLVINGAGLDFWVQKIEQGASADLIVVDTSMIPTMEGALLAGEEHEEGGASDGGVNPHFWLDPILAQKQVEAIASALVMVDPNNKDFYLDNAAKYIGELESLDEEIREATILFSPREFITFHPSWTYFARRYGLVEAAVMVQSHGQEPDIKHAIDVGKEFHVKAIFAEPQFTTSVDAAKTVAAETGAEVLVLDPIGGPRLEGRDSYIALMRYNVDKMGEAMK